MKLIRRKKIKLIKSEIDSPIVRLYGGFKPLYAVIDTGSEITLIDTKAVIEACVPYSVKKQEKNVQMIGVSGNTESSLKIIETVFSLERNNPTYIRTTGYQHDLSDLTKQFKGRGGDGSIAMLIGMDMLKQLGTKIDIKKRKIIIRR